MIETGDIQVIIEDGTNANLCQQIAYIKAGKTEIEEAVQEGIGDFNTNATEKTNTFNSNASAKTLAFNQNADAKTLIYDNNASEKLTAYNENATNKLADFNTNATNKTTAFDLNATNKTTAFNTNASDKTSAFNDNYLDKKALIDAEVQVAKDWATKTDGTVDGVDYSAKYYAQSILPIKDDITAVAEIATDVSDVAEIKDEVTAVAQDKENVDAVAENITNVNTVAGDHANIQTVVNNMTAINNAPTYANNSKIWAEGLDGEVAPLGGTHSSKGWAEIAEQAASGVQNPANRDLSNLTTAGQMIIDSQNGTISNCILEIPQRVNVSIDNNVVTVKAGSKVYIPNGTNVYNEVTIPSDLTRSYAPNDNSTYVVLYRQTGNKLEGYFINGFFSGSTEPTSFGTFAFWYDTANNVIKYTTNSGTTWTTYGDSFPIAIYKKENGVVSFAKDSNGNDMIFNGVGFIENTIFIYPNVKALVSNRYSTGGSLNNISITNDRLFIINWGDGSETNDLYLFADNEFNINRCFTKNYFEQEETPTPLSNLSFWRSNKQNITQKASSGVWGGNWVMIAKYRRESNRITSITPRQPVRLATTEMLDKVQDQVDTNTSDIAGKQDTLVSGTNIKTINSTTVLGSGNFTLANQSLSNLDSTGQMVVDSQNGTISNCILEIPQNLKLELSGNTLTAKSGSILTDSGSVYQTITLTEDKTISISNTANLKRVIFSTSSGTLSQVTFSGCVSGATDSRAGEEYHIWFDTNNKNVNYYGSDGTTASHRTYPLCIVETDSNGVASFAKDSNGNDMIFNGAGFIGHHAFVYPNVKGLLSNGFNADGSLKSTDRENNGLRIVELDTTHNYVALTNYSARISLNTYGDGDKNSYDDLPLDNIFYYCRNENMIAKKNLNGVLSTHQSTKLVAYTYDGTTVTDFTIRQPYEGARNLLTDDIEEQIGDIETALTTIIGA